jgi:hypothetical protein
MAEQCRLAWWGASSALSFYCTDLCELVRSPVPPVALEQAPREHHRYVRKAIRGQKGPP